MQSLDVRELVARYDILLILSLVQSWVFTDLFMSLTLYPLLWILKIFTSATLLPLTATIETPVIVFSLVPACIGGAAYYLLCILNLITPMSFQQRLKSLLFTLGTFFILNLLRLGVFVFLFSEAFPFVNAIHLITWYVLSILFVVGIWFTNVRLFKIKGLPIVDDFVGLWNIARRKKCSTSHARWGYYLWWADADCLSRISSESMCLCPDRAETVLALWWKKFIG